MCHVNNVEYKVGPLLKLGLQHICLTKCFDLMFQVAIVENNGLLVEESFKVEVEEPRPK